ncbi:heme exporter protein CcmB [Vibrio sp. RC27]
MLTTFVLIVRRELLLAYRRQSEVLNPLWFFVLIVTLFPLALGPEPGILTRIAAGIVWVAALLSTLLSLERMFRDDFNDGALEQLLLAPTPLFVIVLAKVIAHWILTALPLLIISPLLAILLAVEWDSWVALMLTLLVGTPTLSFIGAIGVALTVGLRKGSVILSLLVLPLYIPVLIFATSAIESASLGVSYTGQLAVLAAMLTGSMTMTPILIGLSLRVSVE